MSTRGDDRRKKRMEEKERRYGKPSGPRVVGTPRRKPKTGKVRNALKALRGSRNYIALLIGLVAGFAASWAAIEQGFSK